MTLMSPGHTVCVHLDDKRVLQTLERKHENGVISGTCVIDVPKLESTKVE